MIKTKKAKILSVLLVGVVASLAIVFLSGFKNSGKVYAAEVSVSGIKTEYLYKDAVKVPETATVIIDGESYDSDSFYVILPDGNRVSSSNLTLDVCGEYSIVYEKTVGGKRYSAAKTFTVKKKVFELTSGSESMEYGTLNNQFVAVGNPEGLKIGLAEGDVFALNKPFNIYENNLKDLISFNCMQTEPVLCNFITLRLTDCYDPSVYLDITYKRGERYYSTNIVAGTCGGKTVGLVQNEQGNVKVGGDAFEIGKDGTTVYGNNPDNGNYSNLSYYLDTTDKNKIRIYVRVGDGTANALVSELNNDKAYQYSFKGFTDGNVFLSLRAQSLVGVSEAPIQIAKFGDFSGRDFLTTEYYKDDLSPIFLPDDFEKEYKIAVGKEVIVPEVNVKDDYGIRGLADYAVTYEKNTAGASNVSVKNGKFVPNKKGAYTIDYFAYDVYGNRSELSLNLYAVEAENGITADRKLGADVSAGERYKLSDIVKIKSLNENILDIAVTIKTPGGETIEAESFAQVYVFDEVGTYSINYSYSDMFYGGEITADVNVVPNNLPKFENDKLYTNKYYIKNAEYSLLNVKAWNYTASGSEVVNTKTYVSYDGGEYAEINPKEFIVTGNSTVKFKTACADNENVYIESDLRQIVDAGYGNENAVEITKYFGGNMNTEIEDRVPALTAASSDAHFEFINPLVFSQFGLGFEIPLTSDGRKQSATSMTITLTDYFDEDNKYEIEISGRNGRFVATVNGESYSLDSDWNGVKVPIKMSGGILLIGTRNIETVNKFTGDLCFMSVKFDGVSSGFKVKVSEICNQSLTTVSTTSTKVSDGAAPYVYAKLPDEVGSLGQEIIIGRPYVTDVLSPSSYENLSVTVLKSGAYGDETAKDINGRELRGITDFETEIKLILSDYGEYTIIYNYTDGRGNGKGTSLLYRIVTVVDIEAPVLNLENEGKTVNVKAGETFKPKFTVTDNFTADEDLLVYYIVKDSDENFVSVSTSDITITKAGKYTVIVYVVDEAYNSVVKSYYVNVK